MTSKLPKSTMNLKQFLLRQEVLKLYRDIFRAIKQAPDEKTKTELIQWTREDFKSNKHHTDEATIKTLLHYGRKNLSDLRNTLALSKS